MGEEQGVEAGSKRGEQDAWLERAGREGNEGGEAAEGDLKQDDGGTGLGDGGRENEESGKSGG